MQERLIALFNPDLRGRCILLDPDGLWKQYDCDKAVQQLGFSVRHVNDEMALRHTYEESLSQGDDARVLIELDRKMYIPLDIRRRCEIVSMGLDTVFPMLETAKLREFPGIDYDSLAFAEKDLYGSRLNAGATEQFIEEELYSGSIGTRNALHYMDLALSAADNAHSHKDWEPVAQYLGKASLSVHMGCQVEGYAEKKAKIETCFVQWVHANFNKLSASADRNRPVLLSKVCDFVRSRTQGRIAILVMDGMSFENYYTIRRSMARQNWAFDEHSSFSFFPTVTAVARQSIFSGKLPVEHSKPFSLENEEKQWFTYWREHGLKDEEIAFFKSESPEWSARVKALGIVVDYCDAMMHNELQGLSGMRQGLETWLSGGSLERLITKLLSDGFTIYMTSDHGNTSAVAEGRFLKPGLLAEPVSRRAVIYKDYADAGEMDKFHTFEYEGTYLPSNCRTYLFEDGYCYGDKGKEYITHGGMTVEEAIVPFVRIGEMKNGYTGWTEQEH